MAKGERIKSLREKAGYSQTELAERVNISKQTLYKYENNIITNIPSDILEKIASVLGCSPSYFMGWEEYEAPKDTLTYTVPWADKGAKHNPVLTEEEYSFIMEVRQRNDVNFYKRMKAYMDLLTGGDHANR